MYLLPENLERNTRQRQRMESVKNDTKRKVLEFDE